MTRARWRIAAVQLGVVAAGLASRRWPLPGVLAEHTGDALYATAAFLLFAWLWPSASRSALGLMALAFSVAMELSQLATWPWLVELRTTRLGALLLGQGFVWADLIAYALGALLGAGLDAVFFRGSPQGPPPFDRLPHHSSPAL